jgi:hypothetical protein
VDWKTFNEYQEELLKKVVYMRDTKGKEYAHSDERFANFNRLALELGCSNLMVAWIYLKKHLDSIVSYVKDEQVYSVEPIEGRFVDAITYLTLMAGMVEEKRWQREKEEGLQKQLEPYPWLRSALAGDPVQMSLPLREIGS